MRSVKVYVSRVENGHTMPSLDRLEKWPAALEVRVYQLFADSETPPTSVTHERREYAWPRTKKDRAYFRKMTGYLAEVSDSEQELFLYVAGWMLRRRRNKQQR